MRINLLIRIFIAVFLFSQLAVQADNNIKAVKIKYLVTNPLTGKYDKEIDAIDDYEILAGRDSIAPVAIFKNMSTDKEIQFYFSLQIYNSYYNRIVYTQERWLNSYQLANPQVSGIQYIDADGNKLTFPTDKYKQGLPPGGYVKVYFKSFSPNQYVYSHLGRLTITAFSKNQSYPSQNPFPNEDLSDDTVKAKLQVIRFLYYDISGFRNDIDSMRQINIPNPYYWVNKGAELVDGNKFCYNTINAVTIKSMYWNIIEPRHIPVCRMNRLDNYGNDEAKSGRGGDTLISYIVESITTIGYNLHFLCQRGGIVQYGYPRGWSDKILLGPEHRVFESGHPDIEIRKPDELIFEFISADSNHINNLINPKEQYWKTIPRINGTTPIIDNSTFTVFGGGGYRTSIQENDKDSVLSFKQGLRIDPLDDGKDANFIRYSIPIPDTIIKTGYFMLRIRVEAENNSSGSEVTDDADDFYLDFLGIYPNSEVSDVGVSDILAGNTYSILPSKTNSIPVSVQIYNSSAITMSYFNVILIITKSDAIGDPRYYHICGEDSLNPYQTKLVNFPDLKQSDFYEYLKPGENKFQAIAIIQTMGGDLNPYNDTLYKEISVYLGDAIAYDPPDGKNDVPEFSGIYNRGLNMFAISSGNYSEDAAFGVSGGSGSGEIAMKFNFNSQDTIYGFQAWFENHGLCDDVSFLIYDDYNGLPGKPVKNSIMYKQRGMDDLNKKSILSAYSTYLYDKPVILPAGKYWATVAQLGDNGFELGGSASRMGMVTTIVDSINNGLFSTSIIADKSLRKAISDSSNNFKMIPDTIFAYRNSLRDWTPFTPLKGNPAFAHLDLNGKISRPDASINTFTRGSFIPMLRLYMDGSHYTWNSVNESNQNKSISISPNPANDYITVSVGANGCLPESIKIFDVFGREEHPPTPSYEEGRVRVDVSALPPGVYFVRVGERVSKFIKISR